MAKTGEIYKCETCGNMVEVVHEGVGELVCCQKPMELLQEKTQDEGQEKHVPVIEETENSVKVRVGEVPHPMEEKHFIEWIQLIADGVTHRKFLKAGESPEAEFSVKGDKLTAREYCNVHGLWKKG